MRLERFGLVLRSLKAADIEMVRNWRNAPHVRENMEFQEEISPKMQRKWFANLDPECNLYLVAENSGVPFGLLHVKGIDWEEKEGEAGIFVGEQAQLNSFLPVLAVLAMMDLVFEGLGLEKLVAKVRSDRPHILEFNGRLGYRPFSSEGNARFWKLSVQPKVYRLATAELRQKTRAFSRDGIRLEIESDDFAGRWVRTAMELEAGFGQG